MSSVIVGFAPALRLARTEALVVVASAAIATVIPAARATMTSPSKVLKAE